MSTMMIGADRGALEKELRELNDRVQALDNDTAFAREAELTVIDRHKEAGSLTGRVGVREIAEASGVRQRLQDERARLDQKRQGIMESLSGASGGSASGFGGVSGRAADLCPVGHWRSPDIAEQVVTAARTRGAFAVPAAGPFATATIPPPEFQEPVLRDRAVFPQEYVRILDFLPGVPCGTATVEWLKETTASSAAAGVSAGATKPESSAVFARQTATIEVLAHRTRAHRQDLADFAQAQTLLRGSMTRGLVAGENDAVLNGTGTSPEVEGILQTTGIGSVTKTAGEQYVATILRGYAKIRTTGFVEPNLLLINPADFVRVFTQTDDNGSFLLDNPAGPGRPALHGVPVVQTTSCEEGTAVALDTESVVIFVRQGPSLEMGYDGTDFSENMVTLLSEERFAVALARPAGVCEITGLSTIT